MDEFMALPDSSGLELVEGMLAERKTMGALSNYVAAQLAALLVSFCREHLVGHVFASDAVYRCFAHPDTGRKPDVSFVATGRLPGDSIPEGYIDIPADVAVEVVSPNDLAYEVEDKVALYQANGFGEVWVVYPNTRTMYVHRKGEATLRLEDDQGFHGRGPLAEFSFVLSEVFPAR
ncbi:MAG: Uma2 family endonuclease [Tepidisphaeraceae bacterium]